MNKRPRNDAPSMSKLIRACLVGTLAGVAASGVLLAVFSLLCTIIKRIPQSIIEPAVIVVIALSSFVAGYAASRIFGKRGYICGVIAALCYFLIFFVTGMLCVGDEGVSVLVLIRFVLSLAAGVTGGILGVGKAKK